MRQIVLIADNIRSFHNVGSLLRTADGLGVQHVYLTGYTPYPPVKGDTRLPHEQNRALNQIHKTALGAEKSTRWSHFPDPIPVMEKLKNDGYAVASLEQTASSIQLPQFQPPRKVALIIGNEVEGVNNNLLKVADISIEIPMSGGKESFNVVIAAAIALYHLKFAD